MAASEIEPAATTPDVTATTIPMSTPSPPAPPVLGPGEVLKTSGKFSKPTKIPGKNYCKDEVVIRNSDSGKEYMRPVIIKSPVVWNTARYLYPPHFFRPSYSPVYMGPPRPGYMVNPGAKERLVQITGPSDEKINHARQLMEDTIRRNASPVREGGERERIGDSNSSLNSSASEESGHLTQRGSRRSLLHSFSTNDASIGEYKYTVTLGNETVKITGTNHQTVRDARLVLEEYFHIWQQKNCMGDCYPGLDEDVFVDQVTQDMSVLGLNPLDSGNSNHQLSSSSGDSDDVTCVSSVTPPVTAMDPGLAYQPMYPAVSPIRNHQDPNSFIRRPSIKRSNSSNSNPLSPQSSEPVHTRKYTREFLLSCAVSQLSRVTPYDWDIIKEAFPAIVKKASPPFDPTAFLAHPESSAIISLSQLANEPDSD